MNSFASSRTEVFEKNEESLRENKGVDELKDDEVAEFCVLSNKLNACETTAKLNASRLVSHATRLGLREVFAGDLTSARAKGTVWGFSFEDDRAEFWPSRQEE